MGTGNAQAQKKKRGIVKYLKEVQCGNLKKGGERVWSGETQPLFPPTLNMIDRPILTVEGRDLACITRK